MLLWIVEESVLTVTEAGVFVVVVLPGVLVVVVPLNVRVTPAIADVIVLLALVAATPAMLYAASWAAASTE
jgi:hypothetical protein